MIKKMTKHAPEWHAKIAEELTKDFLEVNELAERARHRRLRLGLMFIFVKEQGRADGSIPHGCFADWMKENCPGIPRSTAGDYITEANSVCDLMGWQKSEIRNFEPHKLLICKDSDLTADQAKWKPKLLEIANQEGSFRAVTQYKQVELKDDATVAKLGRRKGEGGASKEQRAKAKELAEAERLEELKENAERFAPWVLENCNLAGFARLDEVKGGAAALAALEQAFIHGAGFIKNLRAGKSDTE